MASDASPVALALAPMAPALTPQAVVLGPITNELVRSAGIARQWQWHWFQSLGISAKGH